MTISVRPSGSLFRFVCPCFFFSLGHHSAICVLQGCWSVHLRQYQKITKVIQSAGSMTRQGYPLLLYVPGDQKSDRWNAGKNPATLDPLEIPLPSGNTFAQWQSSWRSLVLSWPNCLVVGSFISARALAFRTKWAKHVCRRLTHFE